jgi:hypothetical protein
MLAYGLPLHSYLVVYETGWMGSTPKKLAPFMGDYFPLVKASFLALPIAETKIWDIQLFQEVSASTLSVLLQGADPALSGILEPQKSQEPRVPSNSAASQHSLIHLTFTPEFFRMWRKPESTSHSPPPIVETLYVLWSPYDGADRRSLDPLQKLYHIVLQYSPLAFDSSVILIITVERESEVMQCLQEVSETPNLSVNLSNRHANAPA